MNRIAQNVIIVDSAMGNRLALTSANQVIHINELMVNAISVWQTGTTGAILLTGANTAQDILFKSDWISLSSDTAGKLFANNPSWFPFGTPQDFSGLKAPVVTAGTVLLYLV